MCIRALDDSHAIYGDFIRGLHVFNERPAYVKRCRTGRAMDGAHAEAQSALVTTGLNPMAGL